MKKDKDGAEMQHPDVDKVKQEIREEVAKRKGSSHAAGPCNHLECRRENPRAELNDRGILGDFLWKFGARYASIIKKIPLVKNFAEKKYWKLAQPQKSVDRASGRVNDIVEADLDYAGFLEQIKQNAIRGRIKQKIFDITGVFTWRQCQVNIAFYEALTRQKAEIERQKAEIGRRKAEIERQGTEIERQKAEIGGQKAEIERQGTEIEKQRTEIEQQRARALSGDKVLAGLDYKFSMLSRTEDALYQELVDRRGEISESASAIRESLNQRIAEIKRSIKAMDTVKGDNAAGRVGPEIGGEDRK